MIEPHSPLLTKPNNSVLLYKIISSTNFIDMYINKYLYFRRVDTYHDDKRDSDQPVPDKKISKKSKFIYSPDYNARKYYIESRKRTYACCFSTVETQYLWNHYGQDDPNAICLIFNCHYLKDFINSFYGHSRILYNNQYIKNFFHINYGLVNYVDINNQYLNKSFPNPIKYAYLKDKKMFLEEKEFRVTLSCFGMGKFMLPDGTEFTFPESITLGFDFDEAVKKNVLRNIKLFDKNNKRLKTELKDILDDHVFKLLQCR